MTTRTAIRASGAASLAGGLLLAIFVLAHEPGTTDLGLGNIFWHTVESLSLGLINLGAVGIYARHVERSGWFGLAAFVTVFLGGMWFAATGYMEGYGIRSDPPFFIIAIRIAWTVFFGGWVLFGAALLRAGVLPRGGAILCMIAVPAGFALALIGGQQGYLLALGAGTVFGAGQVWLGIGMLQNLNHGSSQKQRDG